MNKKIKLLTLFLLLFAFFNIKNVNAETNTKLFLESPLRNNESYANTISIHGWVMSEEAGTSVKVYIDNKEITEEVRREERQDVINSIKGYGDIATNKTPGYVTNVDLTKYSYGNHTIKVNVLSQSGNIIESTSRSFTRRKPVTKLFLESPLRNNESYANTISIHGWVMSEEAGTSVKVYIDNKEITEEVRREERQDVINSIKGYGDITTNKTPGYVTNVDLTNYKYGIHTLKIEVLDGTNVIISLNRLFNNIKPDTKIEIDSRNANINSNRFSFYGWIMTDANNYSLGILVDGKKINNEVERTERQDVLKSIKGYGGSLKNKTPGYNANIDLSTLKDGNHTIGIGVYSKTGELIKSNIASYKLKKYSGQLYIDSPSTESLSASNDINVIGWSMSTNLNDNVKVYVDNKQINAIIDRIKRDDVINAIKSYGDASINPTPGFNTKINLSNFSQGYHTLKVSLYDDLGELISESTKKFYLYKKMLGIDVSYHQKNINWKSVKDSGAVDFAFIRLGYRGFGETAALKVDTQFKDNINNAYNNGIKVGVYFFSQATNYNEGVEEANFVINNLNIAFPGFDKKLSFPIVIDTEYSHIPHDGRADNIGKNARTDAILGFCNKIKESGLKPMIYSNPTFIKNELDMSRLNEIDLWLAHYTGSIDNTSYYSGTYFIWQYGNNGNIPGINTRVDLDVVM